MRPSLRAVVLLLLAALLLALSAWGAVRLFQEGPPYPVEAMGVSLALGFAGVFWARGARLPRKRGLPLSLAGGCAVAYFAATLGAVPGLAGDAWRGYGALFPGWGPLALALAAGVALGVVFLVKREPVRTASGESESNPSKRK